VREYELLFVLTPDLTEEDVAAATERITALITNRGGEVTKVDAWGRRRLAYPIRHRLDGYYTVVRFRLEPRLLEEVDRSLRLTEQVLRHLIVRAEEVPAPRPEPRASVRVSEESKE
jgi:small subunit ribosomal protein S6